MAEQNQKLSKATTSHEAAQKQILATGLPESGLATALLDTLHNRCDTLRGQTFEIRRLDTELVEAQTRLQEALNRLGSKVSLKQAAILDENKIDLLFKFVRHAEEQRLEREASEKLTSWLAAVPVASQPADTLRDGILLLQQWLAEQRINPVRATGKREWLVAAGITVVVSIVMPIVHPSWLLLLALAGGLAAWAFLRSRLTATPTAVHEIPEQWAALGLSPMATWTPTEVQATLRHLQQEWATSKLHQEKSLRFADLQGRRDQYQKRQRRVDKVRRSWRKNLGIEIDIDNSRLSLLADSVRQAQIAQAHANAYRAKLGEAKKQHDEILAAINREIAPYSTVPAVDADQALALVRDLDQRRQDYRDALGRRAQAADEIRECNNAIITLEADREKLFTDLGLMTDDEPKLHNWIEQFPRYQQAQKDFRLAEHDATSSANALVGHEEMLRLTREQLQSDLESCSRTARELTALDETLGDIRGCVSRAKEESTLEVARAREEACLDELRAARDNDAAKIVGNELVRYLERQQRDDQQPGVLKRAGELFTRITHGRYRLLIERGDPPRFRACDTSLGREQNLDELSSGTRLQLLFSVRVAFVEQQEQGLRLPLIFDETLGNSDEQRARKIIEAAVEIARSGRQVFYFTAQHDELGKWRRALRETDDVAHREFDLARLRGFSEAEHAPKVLDFEPPPSVPAPTPEDDDWIAYGRRLRVPPLDRRGHVGGVHLWYVVDDVNELHRLLSHDIHKWGQLQTLVHIGSADGLNRESLVFRRATAAARVLEHVVRFWQQGRGAPVEPPILKASGAVSDAFFDEVSRLTQELDCDARRLIEELREGRVRRFRTVQIDALERHLVKCGCLDDQPILDATRIHEAIMPVVFADCENGLLSREYVAQLIALVSHESNIGSQSAPWTKVARETEPDTPDSFTCARGR